MKSNQTLIVGIGSPHGDDQAGWLIAERLSGTLQRQAVAVRKAASPADLLDWLDDVDQLVICDACRGLARTGEVQRWTWPDRELLQPVWSGTHNLSLPNALQLAARLGRLPERVVIWSVEGAAGDALAPMSCGVAEAVPKLASAIADELNRATLCTNDRS